MLKAKRVLSILFVFIFFFSFVYIGKVFASSNIIKLTNIIVDEQSPGAAGEIIEYSSNDVETNNTYHSVNNYIDYKLTIKNLDSKPYSIKSISDDNDNPNIYYEYFDYKDKILKPSQEVQIKIRETYNTEISDLNDRTLNNSVKFYFNLVDEDGIEIYTDGDNPSTGDKIMTYVWIGAISLTLILLLLIFRFLRIKKLKKIELEKQRKLERIKELERQKAEQSKQKTKTKPKSKTSTNKKKKITSVILFILLLIPFVAKANSEVEATITFNNNTTLFDKVEVTFNYNGLQKKKIVKYNTLVTAPSIGERNGYLFDGWYSGNRKYDFSNKVTSDIVLNARYTKNTYTITYDVEGATNTNPSTYNVSELPLVLNMPEKEGYEFIGWTGSNGDIPDPYLIILDEARNLEYTAHFEPIYYDITYTGLTEEEYENLSNEDEYTIEDTVTLNNPAMRLDRDGDPSQKFIGWKDDRNNVSSKISFSNSTNDKSFEAVWLDVDPTLYSITYNLNGGDVEGTNPISFTKNTETFTLINPTKVGYNFVGWIGTGLVNPTTVVTIEKGTKQDLEFEAIFEPITYTITYIDASGVTNPTTYTIETNNFTLINPTKTGYEFIGWTGTGLDTETISVTIPRGSYGDRTYTANYNIETYNITYTLHDGVVSTANPDTYTILDTFTLNNPTKEGAIFTGWTGSNGNVPQETVTITNSTGPLTFEANYEPAPYYIHFDKNDELATGTMEDEAMRVGIPKALTKNTFTKVGYAFDKWTTQADGTGTVYNDEEVVEDLATAGTFTLYAKWRKLKVSQLINGAEFNTRMKTLAGDSNPRSTSINTSILKVKYNGNVPDEVKDATHRVSVTAQSDEPTYMWWDDSESIIYYGSEADIIYAPEDCTNMLSYLRNATEIDNNFSTEKTKNMSQMYFGDRELVTSDTSHFNTSLVKSMASMFGENYKMTSYNIKGWDVSQVATFTFMFNQNYKVKSLDLTGWNTISATNMKNMFSSMYELEELKISTFDTRNVVYMNNMFDNERAITSLDLSNFDTSKVQNMSKMFYNMYELTSLNILSFNTSNVTNMEQMFIGTRSIQTLDLSSFDTSKVNNFKSMFSGMSALQTIYVSDSFVTTALTSTPVMFLDDFNLVGGAGTTFSNTNNKSTYAHIDEGVSSPGYFTRK